LGGETLPKGLEARRPQILRALQYVFQSPYGSLNPRRTIGQIVEQPLLQLSNLSERKRLERVVAALEEVSLSARFLARYPDQLSGGERQRVAIGRALIVEPKVIICDEVTSALDVSVQAGIVELLRRLQDERELAVLFITHNLSLVRNLSQEIVVMQHGRILQHGATDAIFSGPRHSYTARLLEDVPHLRASEMNA